jgi:hypothetical protein
LTCETVAENGLAERYVSDTLAGPELEPFEAHLIECERCQSEVLLAVAAREALESGEEETGEEEEPGLPGPSEAREGASVPRRFRVPVKVWVPAAAAAVVAGIFLFRPGPVPQRISELGRIGQAPVYLGIPVRADEAAADSLFDAAMLAYVAEDYSGAARVLGDALEAGADPLPAHFFLGASQLLLERPEEAVQAFGVVIDSGPSPYLAEGHYYRAKAMLQMGEVDPAFADLTAAAQMAGEISPSAEALADSLEAVMGG